MNSWILQRIIYQNTVGKKVTIQKIRKYNLIFNKYNDKYHTKNIVGEGIGKNANGIVKPIRANLKFDTTGLSFDKAKELTNPWWEKVFDNAAENLNVHDASFSVNKSKQVTYQFCVKKEIKF